MKITEGEIRAAIADAHGVQRPRECRVSGCPNPPKCRGYCGGHYGQVRIHGRVIREKLRPWSTKRQRCRLEGCDDWVKAKGLCNLHDQRQRRGADLTAPPRITRRTP